MSSFFSNLFGGSKSKKTKQNVSVVPKNEQKVDDETNNEEEVPVMIRRLSLSKSGRLKERKRKNVPIMDDFIAQDNPKKAEGDSNCDLPDSDIFDTHGIIKEMNSSEKNLSKEKN